MNLEIHSASTIDSIQKKYKFFWQLNSSSRTFAEKIFSIVGAAFIAYGFFDKSATAGGLNIFVSAGISFIISAVLIIYSHRKNKKAYFSKVDKLIQAAPDFNYAYKVDSKGIAYSDFNCNIWFGWQRFSGYCNLDGYLCLIIDDALTSSFMISKAEMTENDIKGLLMHFETKLPEFNKKDLESWL